MKIFCNIVRNCTKVTGAVLICVLLLASTAFAATETTEEKGPGITETEESTAVSSDILSEGTSLGMFSTTGYCSCTKCSGGSGLTYNGTVPAAKHTISADLSVLPLGTTVRIGDTIYTVEDMGSGVDGHKIDIYYDTHDEAWAHGIKQQEVFLIEKPKEKTSGELPAETSAETDSSSSTKGPGEEAA